MSNKLNNLWPEDIGVAGLKPPVAFLREQATLLGQRTKNIVEAKVVTEVWGDGFIHRFLLVVPALDNYRYGLFTVQHSVSLYPLEIQFNDKRIKANDEKTLIAALKQIFSDIETRRIIQSLIAQVIV
jgi:hypothetical protein